MKNTFVIHETHEIDYMPPRQIAKELVKAFPALVVGRARRIGQHVAFVPACSNALSEIQPVELPRRWGLHTITDPINAWLWCNAVRAKLTPRAEPIVLFDRPVQHHRVGVLGEVASGYYAHCDYTVDILGRRDPVAEADELAMLRKVDVAFAASPLLVERFSRHAKRVVHLPCGYLSDLFDGDRAYPEPEAFRGLPSPRILFCGYISGRVDFAGLLATAQSKPEWTFIFLGAVAPDLSAELRASGRAEDMFDRLRRCPNVRYVGRVPLDCVPPFMAACDVGLVPYCLSDFTMTSSPQKNFEYLAMGKPVVATAIPETTCVTDDIVLASVGSSYAAAIQTALSRSRDLRLVEKRKAAARRNSMAVRAQTVIAALVK